MNRRRQLAAGILGSCLLLITVFVAASASGAPLDAPEPDRMARWASRMILRARGGTFVSFPGVVLQSGLSDCGPAALATLLLTLGGSPPSLDSLAILAGTGPRGTTFAGLERAALALGMETELTRLDSAALAVLDTPVIAWVDEGHFVTVVPEAKGDALVLDPQAGPYRISMRGLRRFWRGEALLLRPARNSAASADPLREGGRS